MNLNVLFYSIFFSLFFTLSKSDCPESPKIRLKPSSNVEFEYLSQDSVLISSLSQIILQCQGSKPIDIKFVGLLANSGMRAQMSREITDFFNSSTYCYEIQLSFWTNKKATGNFICWFIENPFVNDSLYIYANGDQVPYLLFSEETISIKASQNNLTLPCISTNPNASVKLYKGISQEYRYLEISESLTYEPKSGFKMNLANTADPYGSYKCDTSQPHDYVYIKIEPKDAYRVYPPYEKLTLRENMTLLLTCEGLEPVGLQGFINDEKVRVRNSSSIDSEEYPFFISYELSAQIDLPNELSCVDLVNKNVLHTWSYRTIDAYSYDNVGIFYNKESSRFICKSHSIQAPSISLLRCSNPIECRLIEGCFKKGSDCSFKKSVGSPCLESFKILSNTKNGCSYITQNEESGTVRCSADDKIYSFTYFSIDNGDLDKKVIRNWREKANQLVKIRMFESKDFNYVGEIIELECSANKFIFVNKLKWIFQFENGSYLIPTELNTKYIEGSNQVEIKSSVKITNPDITEIICLAPLYNSSDWYNVSKTIKIKESFLPEIIQSSPGISHFKQGSNAELQCTASGQPLPKIDWFFKNKILAGDSGTEISENVTKSVILLENISTSHNGTFRCIAYNVRGQDGKDFQVIIENKSLGKEMFYWIGFGALLVLIIFLSVVGVLCKRLKSQQKYIRELSDVELSEFEYGKSIFASEKNLKYIEPETLPYNKGLEIDQQDLEIDYDMKLGSGEFGIVFQGELKLKNCTSELVAVKTLKSRGIMQLKLLLAELKILSYIGQHENIVGLKGAVTNRLKNHSIYVVVELCSLGSLEKYLRSSYLDQNVGAAEGHLKQRNNEYIQANDTITNFELAKWSYEIAHGMEYISSKKVIHGDLACRNILLNEQRVVKISDFGLSKQLYNYSNYFKKQQVPLPFRWLAIEVLKDQNFSTQSDIWAYGITLWEIYTLGEIPYRFMDFNLDFYQKILDGHRLSQPKYANVQIYDQMQNCWKSKPSNRPNFTQLKDFFLGICKNANPSEMDLEQIEHF